MPESLKVTPPAKFRQAQPESTTNPTTTFAGQAPQYQTLGLHQHLKVTTIHTLQRKSCYLTLPTKHLHHLSEKKASKSSMSAAPSPPTNGAAASAAESRDPSGFLSEIIGAPVTVKLNSGVVYKGRYICIHP